MKYLKKFQTHQGYEQYEQSQGFLRPNVSLTVDNNTVHYNGKLSINNAVVTCDSNKTYNAETQIATNIVVTFEGTTLVNGTDYEVLNNQGGVNVGTYSFTVSGKGNYKGSKQGLFDIVKVTPTVVIPVAKALTYQKGVAQELVTAGSTDFGTMKYSLDNVDYSTTVPSRTRAGSYTVYYFVEGDSNVNSTEVATVACSINEKPVTATITLSQDTYTYDGTAKEPTVTVTDGGDVIDPSEYTVTYSNNINAGQASVTITDNVSGDYNVSGVTTFTINKAQGSVTTSPTAITGLTPTGSAQALVNAGSGTGIMMYNLDGGAWSSSIPTATNVGTYTVGYKAAESTNYTESTTGSVSVTINYASVDLGLPSGTKWATMNVGASSETDYGNYYQYGKGASQYAATSGQSDYAGTEEPLATSVDTAAQVWGGNWHMPTKAQLDELTANTTYTWETNFNGSGINGGKFTAQNGNYIFIPAAGRWRNGSLSNEGSLGCAWSSSPNDSSYAFRLTFFSGDKGAGYGSRKDGFSVRPVVG